MTRILNPVSFWKSVITGPSFISTWRTTTSSETVTLPYEAAGTYSGTIDWGDGGPTSLNSYANRAHVYAVAGDYVITVTGVTTGFRFANTGDKTKIRSIQSWGTLRLRNNGWYFWGCSNLDLSSVSDTLDLTGITNMSYMFIGCGSLTSVNNINSWSTSAITNMSSMFSGDILFNQSLSFDTGAVNDMSVMFNDCHAFNGTITFNTISVQNMSAMFSNCDTFNQPLSFNTGAVKNMSYMFQGCSTFNSVLTFTSTAIVENMRAMFSECTAFDQPLVWNTGAVQNMIAMFNSASAFKQNIGSWDISSVTDFSNFMSGKTPATWPTTYFDNLLCAWKLQTVQPGLTIHFGSANYTNATGGPCRTVLQSPPKNWTIYSGGGV